MFRIPFPTPRGEREREKEKEEIGNLWGGKARKHFWHPLPSPTPLNTSKQVNFAHDLAFVRGREAGESSIDKWEKTVVYAHASRVGASERPEARRILLYDLLGGREGGGPCPNRRRRGQKEEERSQRSVRARLLRLSQTEEIK